MKKKDFAKRYLIPLILSGLLAFFAGCQDQTSVDPIDDGIATTDTQAMEMIVDQDSSLSSFEANYNEDGLMDILGKTQESIYPFRVGHKMRLVSKNLLIEFENDTLAKGTLTKTFEGVLLIAASYDSTSEKPDTIIEKPFTSVITRNLIFIKRRNSDGRSDGGFRGWKLAAISLPEGGTQSSNIDITKLIVFLPNGEELVIESPNEYYLRRGDGWWRPIPILFRGESVLLRVELFSAYEEDDFVTLTYGAGRDGNHRSKKRFELVSLTPVENGFEKVYEQTYTTCQFPGHKHAIINAVPRQVVYDDQAPVEAEAWGLPYFVRP